MSTPKKKKTNKSAENMAELESKTGIPCFRNVRGYALGIYEGNDRKI